MTKKAMIELRQSTYREQKVACCKNCKHFNGFYQCRAIIIRDKLVTHQVSEHGICDLWQDRYGLGVTAHEK